MPTTVHWIDEVERVQEQISLDDPEFPTWADIDLPEAGTMEDQGIYGTKAVVKHLIDHRYDYSYGELNRQLGVVLENEASWIQDEFTRSQELFDLDGGQSVQTPPAMNYYNNRCEFASMVHMIKDSDIHVPVKGYKAMSDLDHDGLMTHQYGSFGREYAAAVKDELSYQRVVEGRVKPRDDLGIDFSKSAELNPQLARQITQQYDIERMAERRAKLRQEVTRDLNSITGVPEVPMDDGFKIPGAEEEFEQLEGGTLASRPESINELLDEYNRLAKKRPEIDGPDL